MRISGFTMVKNVSKLYYPFRESILSILPIVDEFIVALGDCDPDDNTPDLIKSINSPKIKVINTIWNTHEFPDGMENAHQTDLAMQACSGDWLFYLQADEVVHEKYLPIIHKSCSDLVDDPEIDGLLLKYRHFFGDYNHYLNTHGWYPKEIRIVRNNRDIHSFQSAQSFRRIPNFDGKSYRDKSGTIKLNVAEVDAYIYHYGWVRPPDFMQKKKKALDSIHKGAERADNLYVNKPLNFDYGPLGKLPLFKETHPAVMEELISKFNWSEFLDYGKKFKANREKFKHEQLKYQLITFIEQKLLNGMQIAGYSNWYIKRKI